MNCGADLTQNHLTINIDGYFVPLERPVDYLINVFQIFYIDFYSLGFAGRELLGEIIFCWSQVFIFFSDCDLHGNYNKKAYVNDFCNSVLIICQSLSYCKNALVYVCKGVSFIF